MHTRKCLRGIRDDFCRSCILVCPDKAIFPEAEGIRIENHLCSGCSICNSACPSEAIHFTWMLPGNLSSEIRKKKTEISCKKVSDPDSAKVPCLGALTLNLLAGLCLEFGTITLNVSQCPSCRFGQYCLSQITGLLYRINKFNNILNIPDTALYLKLNQKVNSLKLKQFTSRKQIFSAISSQVSGKLKMSAANIIYTQSDVIPEEVQFPDRAFFISIFSGYKSLTNCLKKQKNDPVELAPLRKTDKTCTLCTICSDLCPSGALSRNTTEEKNQLFFNWTKCLNCKVCINVCPSGSISQSAWTSDHGSLFGNRKVLIAEAKNKNCLKCGEPFTGNSRRICDICANQICTLSSLSKQFKKL